MAWMYPNSYSNPVWVPDTQQPIRYNGALSDIASSLDPPPANGVSYGNQDITNAINAPAPGQGTNNPDAWLFNAGQPGAHWDGIDHTAEWASEPRGPVGGSFYDNIYKYNAYDPNHTQAAGLRNPEGNPASGYASTAAANSGNAAAGNNNSQVLANDLAAINAKLYGSPTPAPTPLPQYTTPAAQSNSTPSTLWANYNPAQVQQQNQAALAKRQSVFAANGLNPQPQAQGGLSGIANSLTQPNYNTSMATSPTTSANTLRNSSNALPATQGGSTSPVIKPPAVQNTMMSSKPKSMFNTQGASSNSRMFGGMGNSVRGSFGW